MDSFERNALQAKVVSELRSATPDESVGSVESSGINSIVSEQDAFLEQSLSYTVLDFMVLAQAKAVNQEVPYSQAQLQAEKNYADYLKSGSPPLRHLHGETVKEMFVSPNSIKALQVALTITKMENEIGGPPYGPKGPNNRRPGLVAWMTANLNKYPITIHNSPVPISELPKYLPAMMYSHHILKCSKRSF